MILIDYSGIAISSIFSCKCRIEEQAIRHLILNSLRAFNKKYRDDYGEMVLALDGASSHEWRRAKFKFYKSQRKKNREAMEGVDWTELFRIVDKVREEIREYLPFRVIDVQGVEADDIISVLCEKTQEFGQSEPIMIVSSDHDFIQLQRFPNVKQFSPGTQKLIKFEKSPTHQLRSKILRGDGGDGVPNVLSPGDTFDTGGRQTTLYNKQLEEWIIKWDNLENIMKPEVWKRFCENRDVIDLSLVPQEKKDAILAAYDASASTRSNILNYLVSARCTLLIECAGDFESRK